MPESSTNGEAFSRGAFDDDLTRPVVSARVSRDQFHPGQQLGTYRVVRLLGRGGMGEVYEAEHLDTHRRVALKVLNHTLATVAERARFLREGQLAASINHPNSVFVFATEDIDGALVIVMERMSGGTLKDVVQAHGPMPPAAAVDAILQVIDGLEAAAATGVLHRDIKPSNCFVDGDGTVKIGDFGLSLATHAKEETHLTLAGTLLGTPAFAPPEQIRGGTLDVRSDLYSTGATLYYLLTGQAPFASDGIVQLVANVLERDAESPKRVKPDTPDVLGQVVQRCLAKDPSERPDSYQRLRRDLLPFSSHAPTPAAPGVRVMAAILDTFVFGLPLEILGFLNVRGFAILSPARETATVVIGALYFTVLEGIWSASIGKMLFGVRITRPGHRPAGIGRALIRAAIFLSVPEIAIAIARVLVRPAAGTTLARDLIAVAAQLIGLAVLFSTARRGNGFAGLHDLASRTHVVRRFDSPAREPLPMLPHGTRVMAPDARHIGPYAIFETPDHHDIDPVLIGYDPVLRRRVWIHVLPAGSPAVAPSRRDLARPGRLRWLTGTRTPVECWDAYDAPEGLPFVTLAGDPRSWSAVRFWLVDLVRELESTVADHGDVTLDVEHVWITQSSRAILLDFWCPGLPVPASTPIASTSQAPTTAHAEAFVRRFVTIALGRAAATWHGHRIPSIATAPPLPLHAHEFLKQLEQRRYPNLKAMAAALNETLGKTAVLTRNRRAVHLAVCAAVPACALMAAFASAAIRGAFTAGGFVAPLAFSLILTTNVAVWSAAWFRGGLMLRALDIAVVSAAGDEASRRRALLRSMVAWSPCVFFLFATLFGRTLLGTAALMMMGGGAVLAYLTPERGLQDRIVGTWLVPR